MKNKNRLRLDNRIRQQHLSDEEIAQWVDAISENRVGKLPEHIGSHGETCMDCKEKIIEVGQSVKLIDPSEITEADKQFKRQFKAKPVIQLHTILKLAAAAVLIIGVGTLIVHFLNPKIPDANMVFAQNFIPYPDIITEKGVQPGLDSEKVLFLKAISYYNSYKYDSATIVFNNLHKENSANDTVAFYLANAILANGKETETAVDLLIRLSQKENIFTEHSQWYLSLALIKNKDPQQAKSYLIKLSEHSQAYRDQAESILRKLK